MKREERVELIDRLMREDGRYIRVHREVALIAVVAIFFVVARWILK